MYKGYDIRKGKDAESFKEYLRTRNIYFEPSENGNRIHFEVENPDEYVDAWIKNEGKDTTQFVYEFPDGTTKEDVRQAKRLGLKYLGEGRFKSGIVDQFIQGTLAELKFFADEILGYDLHPDYLCPAREFAGLDELYESGYFDDVEDYDLEDKKVRLQGSKLNDSDNSSRIIAEAQKQIDIQQNRMYDCYDEETGDWKEPYAKYEKIDNDANNKSVALCYLIVAYGGVPEWSEGLSYRPEGYDGPVNGRPPKDYPVNFKNDAKVIQMCQQEMDKLCDEDLTDLYYDDKGNEIDDWYTPEGQKLSLDISKKLTALANVIIAYGGKPLLDDGWLGAYDYDAIKGETGLRYSKNN